MLSCKHNKFIKFSEKLASVCLKLSGTACMHHKERIFADYYSYTHRSCPLCINACSRTMCFMLMCTTGLICVGIIIMSSTTNSPSCIYIHIDARCMRGIYVLYRALVIHCLVCSGHYKDRLLMRYHWNKIYSYSAHLGGKNHDIVRILSNTRFLPPKCAEYRSR